MNNLTFRKKIRNAITNTWVIWKTSFSKVFRKFYRDQHQLTSTTSADRYPELFREAVKAIQQSSNAKILSYGCSTGEECFTLKQYFNTATIIGVDINKRNLKQANKKNSSQDIKFLYSSQETIQQEGKYDAIFCLSVLCRWEDTKFLANCEKIYPFVKFEETVSMLADQLVPGGLLIIYNSNFRFEDTAVFNKFESVATPSITDSGFVYKFDRNNNRLHTSHAGCLYRKK